MEQKNEKVEFVALTKAELEEMIMKAALAGASMAAETVEKSHKKEEKEQRDRRLRNTKLLLKNYRMLKASCKEAIFERENNDEDPEQIFEELMSMKEIDDRVIVASIKRSAERTSIILDHIDKMLDVYRIHCSKCSDKEKRQYKVIKWLYIAKNKKTVSELAKEFCVSNVTIYDDIKIAEERLSCLFFGINGLKIFP